MIFNFKNPLRLCASVVQIILVTVFLSGCLAINISPEVRKIINRVTPELKQQNVYVGDPVFIRIFKEENILELWMSPEKSNTYTLIKTYPICKWSGRLGPKIREGDHQAPEGFYATDFQNLNPNSKYHLSFNLQYPNDFDRAHDRTGSFLMVHGDCVSEGCYAMTDGKIEEIYVLVERALLRGQSEVPIHVFPFRMTEDRLLSEVFSPHFDFWKNIKQGHDYFEKYKIPPLWSVTNKQYDFY